MPAAAPAESAGEALPADWGEYSDPAGFHLKAPAGWQVQAAGADEIAIGDPHGTAAALVRVRRLPGRAELAPWLVREYPATEPGLHNVQTLRAEGRGPRVAAAAFDYGSNVFQGRASVVAARDGDIVTIFIAAAARDQFAKSLPTLTRILESLRFDTPPVAKARGATRFAPWADPYEGAMLAAMPDGWQAHGGVMRSAWNTRVAISATSPDGAVQVFFGDATLPRRFVVPGASDAPPGVLGEVYPGPESEMLLPYQRADVLGAALLKSRFDAKVVASYPRHDLVYIAQRSPLLTGTPATATAADLVFRLGDGRVGLMTLATFGVALERAGGAWWVDAVHGYVAPADRRRVGANAMLTLVASLRENPQRAIPIESGTSRVEREFQQWLQWLRDLQQAAVTARLMADDAREDAARGSVPDWRLLSGVTLERLIAIGNVAEAR